jgi:hypothetical protein
MNVLLLSWFTSVTFSFSPGFSPGAVQLDKERNRFNGLLRHAQPILISAAPKTDENENRPSMKTTTLRAA